MKQTYFQLQIYYIMLKNHTIKANYCWKNLKKAMHGMQFSEDSKLDLYRRIGYNPLAGLTF